MSDLTPAVLMAWIEVSGTETKNAAEAAFSLGAG